MSKLGTATKNFISTLFGNTSGYFGGSYPTRRNREAQVLAAKGLIFAAIEKKARALVDTERVITYKVSQTETKPVNMDHWLLKLINKPNPIGLTFDEILRLVQKQMDSSPNGSAFIYTPLDGARPNQIYILPSNTVAIQYHPVFGIAGYNVTINGQASYISADQICHLRDIENAATFQEMLSGKGKILACIQELEIDKEAKEYLTRFFDNDARPPLIMDLVNGEPTGGWENYKARWNQMLPNYQLKAAIDGMKFVDVPSGNLSIDYDSIVKEAKADFTAIMGVPMPLLRAEFQNRATAVETRATFNEETMNPIRKYIAGALTQHFQKFDPTVVFELTPYQYQDTEEMRKQELHELGTGRKTINMFRAERGLPPDPYGDTVFIAKGEEFVPLKVAVTPPEPISPAMPKSIDVQKKSLVSTEEINRIAEMQLYWRKTSNGAKVLESEIAGIVAEVIGTELRNEVIPKYKKQKKGYVVYTRGGVDAVIFDTEAWGNKLKEAVRKAVYDYSFSVGTGTLNRLGEDTPDDFTDLITKAVDESTDKIKSVTGTLRNDLRDVLSDEAQFSTAEEMVVKLEEVFARYGVSGSSAELIGVTTTTTANGAAQHYVAKRIGAKKTWVSQRDDRVRPAHQSADGQKADDEGNFRVGTATLQYPSEPRCRCYLFISR